MDTIQAVNRLDCIEGQEDLNNCYQYWRSFHIIIDVAHIFCLKEKVASTRKNVYLKKYFENFNTCFLLVLVLTFSQLYPSMTFTYTLNITMILHSVLLLWTVMTLWNLTLTII